MVFDDLNYFLYSYFISAQLFYTVSILIFFIMFLLFLTSPLCVDVTL
jgi:DMSO/TMAO reductase YedYZ heme-binding membrane subunit